MRPWIVVTLAGSVLAGCATPEVPRVVAAPETPHLLSSCREHFDPDLRAWECGELTAIESFVEQAGPAEVTEVIDGFAAKFGGKNPRRVDSVLTAAAAPAGEVRRSWVRLEGTSDAGDRVEAELIAESRGTSLRLVTCSTRAADRPCGPVMALIASGDGLLSDSPGKPGELNRATKRDGGDGERR